MITAPIPREQRTSHIRRPRGFTIIEVLLAVGLTSLLMAALYSAMNIYWTMATDSYDEIERGQIARALLREMARDIQSVTFVEQETMESEEESDDGESVDAETAMSSYTNGLFGTASDLVLYISRPDRNNVYVSTQELSSPQDRSSDALIVRYFVAEEGAGGLSGQMANDDTGLSNSSSPVVGLARMQGDLMGLSLAISMGDIETQELASGILAREVAAISFQYWDGADLVEEWDSTSQNAMPLAIVIELTLRTVLSDSDSRIPEETPGMLGTTQHRLVVPIPVSTPYVGEL